VPAAIARRDIAATQEALHDLRIGRAVPPKLLKTELEEAEERCISHPRVRIPLIENPLALLTTQQQLLDTPSWSGIDRNGK
jgi:hypothetical protein